MVNQSNIICPNCSTSLPPNSKFCPECGTPIQENTNQRITNEDPIESIKTSGKEFMNEVGSLFQSVASDPKRSTKQNYCPKCSTPLLKDSKFCPKCGTPIQKNFGSEIHQLEYLEKLAELKDKGIISNEEFEKKKKDILKI